MNIKDALKGISLALCVLFLGGCKDAWEDHNKLLSENSGINLLDKIASEPSLSKFYAYVKQAGLDSSLASSKTYTVWAPDNQAIDALNAQSPAYLSDPATLKNFVKYHIATLLHPVAATQPSVRVLTLTGLSVSIDATHYEEATVSKANQLTKNGVLNIINTALVVKSSVFDAASSLASLKQQGAEMRALDTAAVDPAGKPIIKRSGKWSSLVNRMSAPDSLYTFFVLNDAAYSAELAKITPYYKSTKLRPDSTQSALTKVAMLENLLVRGMFTLNQLPDTLVSVDGVKMPIKKSSIVSSYKANNGIVYVINEMPYLLKHRIKEFKIEGEQSTNRIFSRTDKGANTYIRAKVDSLGVTFNDIQVYDHGTSGFYVQYKKAPVNTVTYNVYARSVSNTVGDRQTVAYTQRYGVPNALIPANTDILFTHVVNPLRYSEVYLGQYTVTQHGTITWRMVSAASTGVNVNTLILDYLRFAPVLP